MPGMLYGMPKDGKNMKYRRYKIFITILFAILISCSDDSKDRITNPPVNHSPVIVEQADTFIAGFITVSICILCSR